MAFELKRLRITKVMLVDRGAGKGVRVALVKVREARSKAMTFDEVMATLNDEQRNVIMGHIEGLIAKAKEPGPGGEGAPAQVPPPLPPEVQKRLDVEKAEREAIAKELGELKEREVVRKYQDEAATLPAIPSLSRDGVAKRLRRADAAGADEGKEERRFLKSIGELVAKSEVLKEYGSRLGDDGESPAGKLKAIAKSFREKDPKLTHAEAYTKACEQHPDLYEAAEGKRQTAA